MRFLLAGLALLVIAGQAFAQLKGEVETIGFQNHYRPGCWTPMVLRIAPQTGNSDMYQVRVLQEDLDKDRVTFTKLISVTGNEEGRPVKEQRFWMYFIPQPTARTGGGRGLPDANIPGDTLRDLQDALAVNVYTSGGRLVSRLPVTNTITSEEPPTSLYTNRRGRKLVLVVTDPGTGSQAVWNDYQKAYGLIEDVDMVSISVGEIPDNVIGLQAVDAILWLNADPAPPSIGDEKLPVLREYVRQGGQLVICQAPQWQRTLLFGDLLPVVFPRYGNQTPPLQGMVNRLTLDPLKQWAEAGAARMNGGVVRELRDWRLPRGPFALSRASGAPILPAFVVKDGAAYRGVVEPPFVVMQERFGADAARVSGAMERILRRYPDQWYNFVPL
jgi:hypothetical protein